MRNKFRVGNVPHNYKGGVRVCHGRIWLLIPNHPHADAKGYVQRSHVIAEAMIGRLIEPSEHVHHINENPADDSPGNLQVLTRADHMRLHRRKDGFKRRGERNGRSKLTEADVRSIKAMLQTSDSQTKIAARFKVTQRVVSLIHRKLAWSHVT